MAWSGSRTAKSASWAFSVSLVERQWIMRGFAGGLRQRHVMLEAHPLLGQHLGRGCLAIEIEATLPDCDDLRVRGERRECVDIECFGGIVVGVEPNGGPQKVVLLGQGDCSATGFKIGPHDDRTHPPLLHTRNDRITIEVELRQLHVAM